MPSEVSTDPWESERSTCTNQWRTSGRRSRAWKPDDPRSVLRSSTAWYTLSEVSTDPQVHPTFLLNQSSHHHRSCLFLVDPNRTWLLILPLLPDAIRRVWKESTSSWAPVKPNLFFGCLWENLEPAMQRKKILFPTQTGSRLLLSTYRIILIHRMKVSLFNETLRREE